MGVSLSELKAEIALPAYAGMDEVAIADALNARNLTGPRETLSRDIIRALFLRGKWSAAKVKASQGDMAATTLVDALSLFNSFDMTNATYRAAIQSALDANVTTGTLTQGDVDAIMALGTQPISRAEQLWGNDTVVTSGDVSRARAA